MKALLESISIILVLFFVIVPWLLGFVIAKGFWSTLACIIPFYSWYLVVEYFFNRYLAC